MKYWAIGGIVYVLYSDESGRCSSLADCQGRRPTDDD